MQDLPLYVPLVFGLAVLMTYFLFAGAAHHTRSFLWLAVAWIALQTILSLQGFYEVATRPPRFLLLVGPPMLFGVGLFLIPGGRRFFKGLDLALLNLVHIVAIPVELVLFWLFLHHGVPRAMTFEGRNYDILSGLTAPVVYYLGFRKRIMPGWALIVWNLLTMALLLNVVSMGARTALGASLGPGPSGNALLHFPYVLLPGFMVPIVLFSHVAAIWQLARLRNITSHSSASSPEHSP